MQKLFKSSARSNDNDGDNDDRRDTQSPSASHASSGRGPPPDETTRLLPNRIDSNNYSGGTPFLSPDDPAVSPYNLFSVRMTRYFTIVLLILTMVWWTLLLVAHFVTPPGFETRGSPFSAFAYATLSATSLIVCLLFFSAPSKSLRMITAVNALLLLINTIIITAVQRTRHEEGWVGITSVTWALLMAIWTIIADRTVQWGKQEEEERLTGRPETRRTLLECVEVSVSGIALLVLCVVSILLTLSLILRSLDAGLAPPGKRYWVDDGKYQIHVYCHGSKSKEPSPTVLFEGGEDAVENGLWQFAENAVKNGSINRYCLADRPGFGWSDTAPSPFSAGQAAEALSEALARAGEVGPWVLVGAGIGSVYSRVFSSRHGTEIEGLLFIDPVHEDLLRRRGAAGRGFLLWLRGILSPLGIDRIPGALFRGRNKEDRVWGRAAYQTSKTIFAKLQESLVANSLTKRDAVTSRAIQYQDTPLTIVSSGVQIRRDKGWESKQKDLTKLTHNLVAWDVVDQAPHEVWTTLEGRNTIEKRLKKLVHRRAGRVGGLKGVEPQQ
ncbi:mitochondrial integral membrane protein [Niveomyces insectorum RCEF 264]|uniref:Mitochondrial integral membrane protein n=1 Tax=Niveomyces insectorum RCEF 264 TaxID=1081102 RepID=A0A167YUH3_9HYPO|nr:mitochondrial integral membrane protein [Niveomyces insectorum RCEF 264]